MAVLKMIDLVGSDFVAVLDIRLSVSISLIGILFVSLVVFRLFQLSLH